MQSLFDTITRIQTTIRDRGGYNRNADDDGHRMRVTMSRLATHKFKLNYYKN